MKKILINGLKLIPPIKRLFEDRENLNRLKTELKYMPGHFYSPYPDLNEISKNQDDLFNRSIESIPGIELHTEDQLNLLNSFHDDANEYPFPTEKEAKYRYFSNNPAYAYSDAFFYYCLLKTFKPQKVIEAGTGMSSCLLLDTNDIYFSGTIDCTFIDPYPKRFYELSGENINSKHRVLKKNLQDIEIDVFKSLNQNDILFIDSTHVAKTGSDVNYILFEILPLLKSGVLIHFHDILYPFEYSKDWIFERIAWNEAYILRAFLQYNQNFKIVFWNHYLAMTHPENLNAIYPDNKKDLGGSLWLQKQSS